LYRAANNSEVEMPAGRTRISVQIFILLCVVLCTSAAPQPARAQPATEEYKVKAAFLFHFAQLVDWPAYALNAEDQSLNLCVFDDEPRRQELQRSLEGKLIGARVLHVRLLNQPQAVQGCNILFLSRDEGRRQETILRSLSGHPVLTVGETDNFLSDGGMIQLRLEGDKVRFDINAGAADSSHLKISSRLLLLATSVNLARGPNRGRLSDAR
jgi:YfiR/HmsC-like